MSGLVASPPATAPGDRRDAAIGAALEVFDAGTKQPEPAALADLAGARRRQMRRSRPAAAAAVAAALLLVAGLGIGLAHISHDHTSMSTSASRSSPVPKATAAAGSVSESQPSSAAPASSAPAITLGSFPDMAALLPALRSYIGEPSAGASISGSASAPSTAPQAPRCQPAASAAVGVAPATVPELRAALTYSGTPAVAYIYRTPASQVAVVLSGPSCRVLASSSF